MKKYVKLILMTFFIAVFISACNSSASSDAKKVDVKQVTAPATATKTMAKTNDNSTSEKQDNSMKLASSDIVEGKQYVKISPEMQTDVASGKIEVAELFWLACPHCYALEPEIAKYKASLPDYVEFKQVPAMLNPGWAADANTFFIANILDPKGSKNLVTKIFQSIHEQKRRLRSPKAVTRFFVEQGYTEEQVEKVKKSMAFQTELVRAQEFSQGSQADSVPTIIVNGKYRTSPYMAGGNDKVIDVIRMLVEKENNPQ